MEVEAKIVSDRMAPKTNVCWVRPVTGRRVPICVRLPDGIEVRCDDVVIIDTEVETVVRKVEG